MATESLDITTIRQRLRRLPLFPLPSSVLIPGGQLPLHVFEPRYRELVTDALAADGLLAVGLLEESEGTVFSDSERPAIRSVVGVGRIVAHTELPRERYFIVVQGVLRVRVVRELDTDKPYREVQALPVRDDDPTNPTEILTAVQVLRQLIAKLAQQLPQQAGNALLSACTKESDPGRLADIVGSAVLDNHEHRQRFLEESDSSRRLELMNLAVATVLSLNNEPPLEHAPN